MKFIKFSALLFFATAGLFYLSACSGGGSSTTWEYEKQQERVAMEPPDALSAQDMDSGISHPPVKIALLLPLSGENKSLGRDMEKSAQMALFYSNDENITLIIRDTKGTSEGAQIATRQVIDEGAQIILGPLLAQSTQGALGVANRYNVPVISFTTDWTMANKGAFVMGFTPFDQVERIAFAARERGLFRVGVLAPQGRYGNAVTAAWRDSANRAGITTISTTMLPQTSGQELVGAIEQFAQDASQMDAVFMPIGGSQGRTVANLLSANNMPPSAVTRLGTGLWDDRIMTREVALNGALFAAPNPSTRSEFEKKFFDLYAKRPHRLATLSYDAMALCAVLARTDKKPYSQERLTSPSGFSGLDGIFRFNQNGLAERGLSVLEINNGNIEVSSKAASSFLAQPNQ